MNKINYVMYNDGVFLARFQPPHIGHLGVIKKALEECKRVHVIIGSANKEGTVRNPINLETRLTLVKKLLFANLSKEDLSRVCLYTLNDWNEENSKSDDVSWGRYLYYNIVGGIGNKSFTLYYSDDPEIIHGWFDHDPRLKDHVILRCLNRNEIAKGMCATDLRAWLVKYYTQQEKLSDSGVNPNLNLSVGASAIAEAMGRPDLCNLDIEHLAKIIAEAEKSQKKETPTQDSVYVQPSDIKNSSISVVPSETVTLTQTPIKAYTFEGLKELNRYWSQLKRNVKVWGTSIAPEWENFDNFAAWANSSGYIIGKSKISRKDRKGIFSPDNCVVMPINKTSDIEADKKPTQLSLEMMEILDALNVNPKYSESALFKITVATLAKGGNGSDAKRLYAAYITLRRDANLAKIDFSFRQNPEDFVYWAMAAGFSKETPYIMRYDKNKPFTIDNLVFSKSPRKLPEIQGSRLAINRIKCKICGDVITSTYVHDYKTCKCGRVAVDGGNEYPRRVGNIEDWEEQSVYVPKTASKEVEA